MQPFNSRKLIYLEAARGVASVIVIFHHICLAFLPWMKQRFPDGLNWSLLYIFVNGDGAVMFFFTLSGFVLSISLMRKPDLEAASFSALKRLPRLALPAAISILAGFLILVSGFSYYSQAAAISHSPWLAGFANAEFPDRFQPSILDAVKQVFLVFVAPRSFYYSSNLWTMRSEFYGSLLTFGVAYAAGRWISRDQAKQSTALIALAAAVICALAVFAHALAPFVVGSILAYCWVNFSIKISKTIETVAFALSYVLMCTPNYACNLIASAVFLLTITHSPQAERLLSTRLGFWLGKLSFPIYLVHSLVICSVGSFVYYFVYQYSQVGLVAALAAAPVILLVTLLLSIPLLMIDEWWVIELNGFVKLAKNLISKKAQSQSAKADVSKS